MSTIPNQSLTAGNSFRQDIMPDSRFSNHVKKQSVSSYKSLDAGLTIRTKEGDLVTLTSKSFSELDAFVYNRKGVINTKSDKGVIRTKSGKSTIIHNKREVTLTSGKSFSFSVAGDLNEKEIGDIENIIKGIDGVISEIARGDMGNAVRKALAMGDYGTVSMYSADIRYIKSYAVTTDTQIDATNALPVNKIHPEWQKPDTMIPLLSELSRANYDFTENKNDPVSTMDQFIKKMAEHLAKYDKKLLDKAREAIDSLFSYHHKPVTAGSIFHIRDQ